MPRYARPRRGEVWNVSLDPAVLGKDVNDYKEFLEQFDGVPCQFAADESYHVEKMTAVYQKGESCDLVVIGDGMRNFRRFLRTDEPTFTQFFEAHPLRERVGQG